MKPNEHVFVLGNGPSLRGVDLRRFAGAATVGMNAAYRHWRRIGWYPTHYCCLDDELVASHHAGIRSLVHEGLVTTAFVTVRMLEYYPELIEDERWVIFESFHKPSFDARGRKLELPFFDHPAFRASEPWKVTTGAFAVRYAMFLGFRRLHLLGIDCRYVDAAVEARPVGGLSLEITHTPAANPNYFFDDYQRKGDRFQVPNPPIYGDVHLQSLELVRDDVARLSLPVEISVCSRASRLVSEGVFPYEDLDQALRSVLADVAPLQSARSVAPRPTDASWSGQAIAESGGPARTASWVPPKPSRYDRFYLWAKTRVPPLFLLGRMVMWTARRTLARRP